MLGLTVGALMALLFGLDLANAIPFDRASLVADLGFLVSGTLLTELSLDYCLINVGLGYGEGHCRTRIARSVSLNK